MVSSSSRFSSSLFIFAFQRSVTFEIGIIRTTCEAPFQFNVSDFVFHIQKSLNMGHTRIAPPSINSTLSVIVCLVVDASVRDAPSLFLYFVTGVSNDHSASGA